MVGVRRVNIDKPGRPTIGLGNQGGGSDDVAGFNVTAAANDPKNFGAPALNPESARTELDVSGDKAVLVTAEPDGGSPAPTSDPVLATEMT